MKNLLAKKVKKNNKGFTLVELIIVIAIIAILVAVLAPNYVRYVDRSRWSSDQNECETLLQEVKTAIVEAQNNGAGEITGKITVGPTTTKPNLSGVTDTSGEFAKALSSADKNWSDITVRHKNKQKLNGDSAEKNYTQYEITLSDGGASGKWVESAS